MQRKVQVFKNVEFKSSDWEIIRGAAPRHCKRVPDQVGMLIAFGVDFEELQAGVGPYTTAIVEMSDGTVQTPSVTMIKFITSGEEHGE